MPDQNQLNRNLLNIILQEDLTPEIKLAKVKMLLGMGVNPFIVFESKRLGQDGKPLQLAPVFLKVLERGDDKIVKAMLAHFGSRIDLSEPCPNVNISYPLVDE